MKILGISGKKESGKSTVAEIIKSIYADVYWRSKPTYIIAFADSLKIEVADACKVTIEDINQEKKIFRIILQWWGTDFRRNLYGDDYWLLKFANTIKSLPTNSLVIVPDVRFHNEYEMLRKAKAKLWRVVRHNLSGAPNDTHKSETELDDFKFDEIIYNNGTLEELKTHITNLWTIQSQSKKK